ncbi:hypothetical protein GCM10009555_102310 [Acrocarpospora macrocephala]|uniref:Aminoglycoside phosphotransferase domain-containing protein n=1 Tax=Acrocarpospora macrocephala TaxID=150177 RepID=A0A5M3WDK1_9ACTN|nr:phosphotransferase [Acrocarpospora macrocephala]GES07155.1 hypothetical protein Amac_007500 [Acrocarpospora macrocephala]
MKDKPEGVDETHLAAVLADVWGLDIRGLRHLPLGAGSHHWSAIETSGRTRFVTVDDLGDDSSREFSELEQALSTAQTLGRDLDFIVAPIPTRIDTPLWWLNPRYAVSVFPTIDGESGDFGAHPPQDHPEVTALLAELHQATPVVAATAPHADLALPGRDNLHDALNNLGHPWTGGPFSEPARRLLTTHAPHIERQLNEFDQLAAEVRHRSQVITHGEPHPGNFIRTRTGLKLIDWETARLAPPERDLWMLDTLDAYTEITGYVADSAGLSYYRLRWQLTDIAIFVRELRGPHQATQDITDSWTYLNSYFD